MFGLRPGSSELRAATESHGSPNPHATHPHPPPGRRRGLGPGDDGAGPGDRGQGRRHARRAHRRRLLRRLVARRLQGRHRRLPPTHRSRSGTRRRAKPSKPSRATPISSSPSRSIRRASGSSRAARTSRRGSGRCPAPSPSKTLTGPAGIPSLALRPDGKQAAARREGRDDLGPRRRQGRSDDRQAAADVESVAWRATRPRSPRATRAGPSASSIPPMAAQGTIDQPADTVLGLAYLPNNTASSRPAPTASPASGRCRSSRAEVDRGQRRCLRGRGRWLEVRPRPGKGTPPGPRRGRRGRRRDQVPAPAPTGLALNGDGSRVAAAFDKSVVVYETKSGKDVRKLEGLPSPVSSLADSGRRQPGCCGWRRRHDPRLRSR